jgi:hypothetical protein
LPVAADYNQQAARLKSIHFNFTAWMPSVGLVVFTQ